MMDFFARHFQIRLLSVLSAVFAMLNASLIPAYAQVQEPTTPSFSRPLLERLVAPIALYPDALLTHVLMAATYPFEIVQATRWREANPDVRGGALEDAMQGQTWDESVKAVVAFPDVLRMMNEKLDWTQQLGEAFLAQQDDVFAAVQALRDRAQIAGNLKTSKELRVTRGTRDDGLAYTEIEPVSSEEVYVPVYDPQVIYGVWPYPDDPPYYWYPRGWRRDQVIWFGTAILVGAALWAAWDWRRRGIIVNAGRFNAFNRTKVVNPAWAFKPQHRQGVPFKAQTLTKKFGPIAAPTAVQRTLLKQHLKASGGVLKPGPISQHRNPGLKTTPNVLKTTPHTISGATGAGSTDKQVKSLTTKRPLHRETPSTGQSTTNKSSSSRSTTTHKSTGSGTARSSQGAVTTHKNAVVKPMPKLTPKTVVKPVVKQVPKNVEKKP